MRIGVVGRGSYIGRSFHAFINAVSDHTCDLIPSRERAWAEADFSAYDCVLVCAGIAHNETKSCSEAKYAAINTIMPLEIAQMTKAKGVRHLIFLSSIIVYGEDDPIGNPKVINPNTVPSPTGAYGRSKLEAERRILPLADAEFAVAAIRLPMVYGSGCKGNFQALLDLAKWLPVSLNNENSRSMIYIENLNHYLLDCVEAKAGGVLFPQNQEYVSTKGIFECVAAIRGRRPLFIHVPQPFFGLLAKVVPVLKKLYGTKVYDPALSTNMASYNVVSFEESIRHSLA